MSNETIEQNSSTTATPPFTVTERYVIYIFFYCILTGIVFNGLSVRIWFGVWRNKEMRSRFFIVVAFITFCRTCFCTQTVVMSVYRVLLIPRLTTESPLRIVCHSLHFWTINGTTLELTLLCTLVIDRMIAIMAPSTYHTFRDKSMFYICLVQFFLVSAIMLIPSYLVETMSQSALCLNTYSFTSNNFNTFRKMLDLVLVLFILLLYLVLIAYVRVKAKAMQTSAQHSEASKITLQRQLKLMPVLRYMVLLHCGLSLLSRALLYSNVVVTSDYVAKRVAALGSICIALDVGLNGVSLLMTNKDIRNVALPCKNKTKVTAINGNANLALA